MSSEILENTLVSLCLLVVDCPHATPKWENNGVIVLRNQNIKHGRLDLSAPSFTDEEHYQGRVKRAVPQAGDIVITREAPMGDVCQIPKGLRCCLGQRQVLLRPDLKKIDGRFLLFALQSPYIQHQIGWNEGTGSTVSNLRIPVLEALKIPTPSIKLQLEIAATLGAIDDSIDLLRETNKTLEAIAQAIFKSWFVDFDPVRAKKEGREPEGIDAETAALFPDSFEESELGLIPKGWQVEPLSELFDFKEGPGIRNWQYTNSDEGTRFINIRCIQDGDLNIATASRITDEEANGKYAHFHLKVWDVVVSTSGTLGRSAIVRQEHLPLMLNTSVIRFQPIKGKTEFCFVYEYLNSPEFLFTLESMASGSVQKNFGPMHLKQMKLLCPPFNLISYYESISRPFFEKIVANRAKISNITILRDILLPRLISGQLRLPDAESMVEEATA